MRAAATVGQGGQAGSVGADVVAGDEVGYRRRVALDDCEDAAAVVAGDEVAFQAVGDAVVVCANAVAASTHVDATAGKAVVPLGMADHAAISSDFVTRHHIVLGNGLGDQDAPITVAGNQVAFYAIAYAVAVGADEVVAGIGADEDAGVVGNGRRAGQVDAEIIAINPVAAIRKQNDGRAGGKIIDRQAAHGAAAAGDAQRLG